MFTGFLAVEESQSSSDYRPKAVALLPWWKAGTVCLWPPKNKDREWTDRHLPMLIVSGHRRWLSVGNKLSTNCCLKLAEAVAGTSGLWCTPPLKECVGDSSTLSLSAPASEYLAYWELGTPCPSSWSGQACCQCCCHLHLSHSHAEPSPCMGSWAPCSVLRGSSKP